MAAKTVRSYEVYQRQTERDIPIVVPPGFSLQPDFIAEPYATLALLRDNYSCFRDWDTNTLWVTRYDDVTSLIADDANFGTRQRGLSYGSDFSGRDLHEDPLVSMAIASGIQDGAPSIAEVSLYNFVNCAEPDLIANFVEPFIESLLASVVGIHISDADRFGTLWRVINEGVCWNTNREDRGRRAITELVTLITEYLPKKRSDPTNDILSAAMSCSTGGPEDELALNVVATLMELDLRILEGSLANLLYLMMTHPDQYELVRQNDELVERAWQETLRHSPPITEVHRYAKHEVERFGQLIPMGGLVICSVAAANRDPKIFNEPDRFDITRKDLAYREPRGQFRIDGLPAGVVPSLGAPATLPTDSPSTYGLTAYAAIVAAKSVLLGSNHFQLAEPHDHTIAARWPEDARVCRRLLVKRGA